MKRFRNFYKTWYRPNLQAIIVVGDIDVDYVKRKSKNFYSFRKSG